MVLQYNDNAVAIEWDGNKFLLPDDNGALKALAEKDFKNDVRDRFTYSFAKWEGFKVEIFRRITKEK